MNSKECYAVYKGDLFIDLGTIEYLSKKLSIKPDTLKFMTYPSYYKRLQKRNTSYKDGYLIVIKIEDDIYDQ